jgi:hypothetical protein
MERDVIQMCLLEVRQSLLEDIIRLKANKVSNFLAYKQLLQSFDLVNQKLMKYKKLSNYAKLTS